MWAFLVDGISLLLVFGVCRDVHEDKCFEDLDLGVYLYDFSCNLCFQLRAIRCECLGGRSPTFVRCLIRSAVPSGVGCFSSVSDSLLQMVSVVLPSGVWGSFVFSLRLSFWHCPE